MNSRAFPALILILLAACTGPGPSQAPALPPSATFIPSAAVTPPVTQTMTQTMTPQSSPTRTPQPSAAPYPTSASLSSILAVFPIKIGTLWKYSVEIKYVDPISYTQTATWTGIITETVVDQAVQEDGSLIFTSKIETDSPLPEGVWNRVDTKEYVVSGESVYSGGEILRWPVPESLSWPWAAGYTWDAHLIDDLETPYKKLAGCYEIWLYTNSDTTVNTFCPGIGFARYLYHHHGSVQDEDWILIDFVAGK